MVNEKINNLINNGNSDAIRGLASRIRDNSEGGSLNERVKRGGNSVVDELKAKNTIVNRPETDGGGLQDRINKLK